MLLLQWVADRVSTDTAETFLQYTLDAELQFPIHFRNCIRAEGAYKAGPRVKPGVTGRERLSNVEGAGKSIPCRG